MDGWVGGKGVWQVAMSVKYGCLLTVMITFSMDFLRIHLINMVLINSMFMNVVHELILFC